MANIIFCPNCADKKECIKKGTSAAGNPRYKCKECGKSFVDESVTPTKQGLVKDNTVKQEKTTKTTVKKETTKKETVIPPKTTIKVNNNEVKVVDGVVSVDEAFALISTYFREISKTKVDSKEVDGNIIINFTVSTGTKG